MAVALFIPSTETSALAPIAVLKVPVVTVGVRLNRGKVRLKEIYDRKYKVPVRTDVRPGGLYN